jgi:glycosyltransferase involved in cell wall biosynthesis
MQKNLSTIYNGIDLNVFMPVAVEPDNNPLHLLTISGLAPHKNGHCLVEALRILGERDGLHPRIDWVGNLPTNGERFVYLRRLNQAIEDYGLTQQWHWLNQRSDIVHQLHKHDILVHPSYIEGLPNAVCEALACARPVIVSDIPEHSFLVQDGQSGYLFRHNDPYDLADKIKKVALLSVEERKELGLRGRKYAESNLSINRLVDEYECLFCEVMNIRP